MIFTPSNNVFYVHSAKLILKKIEDLLKSCFCLSVVLKRVLV